VLDLSWIAVSFPEVCSEGINGNFRKKAYLSSLLNIQ